MRRAPFLLAALAVMVTGGSGNLPDIPASQREGTTAAGREAPGASGGAWPNAFSWAVGVAGMTLAAAPQGAGAPQSEAEAAEPAPPTAPNAPAEPAPSDPAPPAGDRDIRFQFEGIPYADVIERFAQMANKPLVADAKVEGTLTFHDGRTYTYGEALDTLNVILAMKGVMVIETDRFLRLVPFKQLPQMPLRIFRGLDDAGDVRAGEVVTVVLTLQNLESTEILDGIRPLLSDAGSIAPLSRGRGLIVTDRMGNIRRIRDLLTEVDTASPVQRQMKAYTLLHSSGAVLSDLINKTFGSATAPVRTRYNEQQKRYETMPADPNDYVTAVWDEASRTLVMYGPGERVMMGEELIQKFEQKDGAHASEVKIYYPQSRALELARMIRQAIPGVANEGETGTAASTKARLIPDPASNRLIVTAPAASQMEAIERFIRSVEGENGSGGTLNSETVELTRVFQLKVADPAMLARVLSDALGRDQSGGRRGGGGGSGGGGGGRITADANSHSVVVTGSPGELQKASEIVRQLDAEAVPTGPLETRFIPVESGEEASRLAPLVTQLYQDQFNAPGGEKAHAKITADSGSRRLIVTASASHMAKIEALLKQLQAPSSAREAREFRIFTLKSAKWDAIGRTVTSLITEKMEEAQFRGTPKPLVLPDAPNNRLLVTATARQIDEIAKIVTALDLAPAQVQTTLAFIPVQSQAAKALAPLVTQLLGQMRDPASDAPAPRILADASDRQLIVMASAEDLEMVRGLVEQLEQAKPPAAERLLKPVPVQSRAVAELMPLVERLYQEQIRGLPQVQGGAATLVAEPERSRVLVSGSSDEIARVEAIIRQLDPADGPVAREETRVFRLRSGQASDLAGLIEKSLNAQREQVKVLVDVRSNSLVVTGKGESVTEAAALIEQLDTQPDASAREMRIFQLKAAQPATLLPLLTDTLSELLKTQRGPHHVLSIKFVPDASGNRIIASGKADELDQAELLIERLDQPGQPADGARVFKLNSARANELSRVISQAMVSSDWRSRGQSRVTVAADEKTNSLIVSGSRQDLIDVELIIQNLDGPVATSSRVMKVFDLQSGDAAALVRLASQAFAGKAGSMPGADEVSITADPGGRRLVALAPASLMAQIESVIRALDKPAETEQRQLHLIELTKGTATELLASLSRIYTEQFHDNKERAPAFFPASGGRAIAIVGSERQHTIARQVVQTLETGSEQAPRATQVFELGSPEELRRILPLVQQLYRDQAKTASSTAPADAQFLSDDVAGRLIVSGRKEDLAGVGRILEQIKSGAAPVQGRETRTFEVGQPDDVQRLLVLVQQLYRDQWKGKETSDPADAQIMGDAATGRLIVSGKAAHIEQIEAIINELLKGESKQSPRETRVYELKSARASELAGTVRMLYDERARHRTGSARALILPDQATNRLVVSGPADELDAIEGLIKQLDQVSTQTATTRVYRLKTSQATEVAAILSSALVQVTPYGRTVPRVSVGADSKSNTLVVSGAPEDLQSAAMIIEQLDSGRDGEPRVVRTILLKKAKPTEAATKIRELYLDQMKGRPEAGAADALIMPDPSAGSLIVAGQLDQLKLIEQLALHLEASQPEPVRRETRAFDVGSVDDVQRLLPLVQQLYREQLRGTESSEPADAQILADPAKGQLLVTARSAHIERIKSILEQLKGEAVPDEVATRVYELKAARAGELSATVRVLYQEQARRRPGGGKAMILPDQATNRLIVSGTLEDLDGIEAIVQKLDQVTSQTGNTRVFRLKTSQAEEVASLLSRTLLQVSPYGRVMPRVAAGADSKSNTLIISGAPDDLQAAAAIIDQLDNAIQKEERGMRLIGVRTEDPAAFGLKVRQLYLDQMKGTTDGSVADALIMGDGASGRLIVAGAISQLDRIEQIASELQSGSAVDEQPRETKVYDLKSARPSQLAQTVRSLHEEWLRARPGAPVSRTLILPDEATNRLIISGPSDEVGRIEEIVNKLDQVSAQTAGTRVFKLRSSEADQLASILSTALMEVNRFGRPVPRLSIGADNKSNTLIVSGEPEALQAAAVIIEQLDSLAPRESRQVRVIPLTGGVASEVATQVRQIYLDQMKAQPDGGTADALILGDDYSNRLIITASESQVRLIETVVQTLQTSGQGSPRQLRLFMLKNNSAASVATMISQLFARQIRTVDPSQRLTVTASPDDRTLILDAGGQVLDQIETLISALDVEPARGLIELRTYHLKESNAAEIAPTLSRLFAERRDWRRRPPPEPVIEPRFEADAGSNVLLVAATRDQFAQIEALIQELQAPAELTSETRVVRLERGDPLQIASVLESVLNGQSSGGYRGGFRGYRRSFGAVDPGQVRVTPAPSIQALVLQGSPEKLESVAGLIQTLDQAVASDRSIEAVRLEKADADTLAEAVNQAYRSRGMADPNRRATVTPVPGANMLLIQAPADEAEKIRELIKTLDTESTSAGSEIRMFKLENGTARELVRVIGPILEDMARAQMRQSRGRRQAQVSVSADERTNTLIVSGGAEHFHTVEQLLVTLDKTPERSNRDVQFLWLENANAIEVAVKLEAMFADRTTEERVVVEADALSNSLTVIGNRSVLLEVQEIVARIDESSKDTTLQVRMVPLSDIPAEQMARMLENIYSQMSQNQVQIVDRIAPPPRKPALPGAPPSAEPDQAPPSAEPSREGAPSGAPSTNLPPVIIAVDKAANALILSGPAHELDQIDRLITDLSFTFVSGDAEFRQFALKEADPVVVAKTLTELFKQEPVRVEQKQGEAPKTVTPPPKITIVAEPRTRSVIIRAKPTDFTLLESLILQLDAKGLSSQLEYRLVRLEHAEPEKALPLVNQMVTQLNAVRPGEPIAVAVDVRSRSVFMVGRDTVLEQIEELVSGLDTPAEFAELEVMLVPLKNAASGQLANVLRQMLRPGTQGEATPEMRELQEQVRRLQIRNPEGEPVQLDLRQPIKILSDSAPGAPSGANRLILFSTPDNLAALAAVAAMLDTVPLLDAIRLFALDHADAATVQRVLNDLFGRGGRGAAARSGERPIITIDERTNTLIVSGSDAAFSVVQNLLEKLDQETPLALRDIRIIPLENADAGIVAAALQRLLDARVSRQAGLGRAEAEALRVLVVGDPRTNSLLVGGSNEGFELVQSLAKELDRAAPALSGQIRLVPLTNATAQTLSATLTALFQRRYQSARAADSIRDRPIILPDARSNSLLIAAGVEDNRALDELIEKLDQKPENPAMLLSVIALEHNDAIRVAAIIQSMFTARRRGLTPPGQPPSPQDNVDIEADPLTNALVISASPENLEAIRELIAKVDIEPSAEGGVVQAFVLRHTDAQRAASMIRSLIDQGVYRPGASVAGRRRSPRDALAVTVDSRSNTLIISASPENMAVVRELLVQIDAPDSTAPDVVRLFPLSHAKASHLATVLEQFFRAKRAGEATADGADRSIPVTVTADDRTNTLLVTGGKDAFEAIERMVLQLDVADSASRTTFRVFPLKQATASKVQSALQRLFSNRPAQIRGQPSDPVTIVADHWANALIIGASNDDLALADSLIAQLDAAPAGADLEVQVLPLSKADVRKVAQTVQALFRDATTGGLSPVTANVDERLNALIVSAGEADMKRIVELVKKLDTDMVARISEIRVFPLSHASAAELAVILNSILNGRPLDLTDASPSRQSLLQFITRTEEGQELVASALKEGILVTPDPRTNALVVSAPADYMQLLQNVITRLDSSSPQVAQIRVFILKNADARQMALVLGNVFRLQPGSAAAGAQRTVEYTLVLAAGEGGTNETAKAVVGSAERHALTVTVDLRTNSLLVGGTDHYVALASSIINTLDSSPAQERETTVYRLRNSRAEEVGAALQRFLTLDQQQTADLLSPAAQGTAQRVLEREVAIVPEPISNSLLISVSPRYRAQIDKLIEDLDQPQPQVLIQVLLAEVTLDSTSELGVEWTYTSKIGNSGVSSGTDFGVADAMRSFGGFSSAVTGGNFNFILRALQNDGRLEVLSRPQILTADNQEASINVGRRVPLITDSRITERGDTINQYEWEDVGVDLTVTPRISPDGFVKMDIGPSISQLTSSTIDISPGFSVPIISQRRATTTVTVQSGQSIIIGGLISTTDDTRIKKMPFFGNIPYLGVLFRSSKRMEERKELLIILTPQILVKLDDKGRVKDARSMTLEQLEKSTIKDEIHRDRLQKQMLDPLLPEYYLEKPVPGQNDKFDAPSPKT